MPDNKFGGHIATWTENTSHLQFIRITGDIQSNNTVAVHSYKGTYQCNGAGNNLYQTAGVNSTITSLYGRFPKFTS